MDSETMGEFRRLLSHHGIKVCDMTMVVERDTKDACRVIAGPKAPRTEVVYIGLLHEIFYKVYADHQCAVVIMNTKGTRNHPMLKDVCPYMHTNFVKGSLWAMLYKDDVVCAHQNETNPVERAVEFLMGTDECPVCLEPLVDGETYILKCYHKVHVTCMKEWTGKNCTCDKKGQIWSTCPTCRAKHLAGRFSRVACP